LVSETALIGSIDSHFPGRCFVYHGELLENHRTFASYGIHSSDSVIALVADGSTAADRRWATITSASDTFDEMVRSIMNPTSRMENLRIRDIRALRLESRPRTYARFLQSFESPIAPESRQKRIPTITPDRAEK
jgi:hypothetical protein